jgi:hypothetical protein
MCAKHARSPGLPPLPDIGAPQPLLKPDPVLLETKEHCWQICTHHILSLGFSSVYSLSDTSQLGAEGGQSKLSLVSVSSVEQVTAVCDLVSASIASALFRIDTFFARRGAGLGKKSKKKDLG